MRGNPFEMHAHAPSDPKTHAHTQRHEAPKRLVKTLCITGVIMCAEIVGGAWSGSLALIADAAHMLFDLLALAIALGAHQIGKRPADHRRTYGFRRFEVLGALFNGFLLIVTSIGIAYEASQRIMHPVPVGIGVMEAVAMVGLLANVASVVILGGDHHDLGVRGAFWHVLADLLSSAAVVVGGGIMYVTHWLWLDPVLSLGIALVIVTGSLRMLREVVDVLLEAVPRELSVVAIRQAITGCPGVLDVHDLHVWSITAGLPALSAHVVVSDVQDAHAVRKYIAHVLAQQFDIHHVTLQMETETHTKHDLGLCGCG